MWKEWEMKSCHREQEKEARMTEIAMGDCVKRDLERVGENGKKEHQMGGTEDSLR